MDVSLFRSTLNTVNSVIGVSVLAMPFCFNQCGYILGIVVLLFVAYVTYLSSCQLLQLANYHKKRSFEFLAMHIFGAPGKLVVELSMIGLMMGTFVAFFVIIGDLGPEIARDLLGVQVTPRARTLFLLFLGLFVVLPLSLQKNIDNLSSLSAISLLFYFSLLLHIVFMASQRFFGSKGGSGLLVWNPTGIFKCMPIMSMSFGCQTQLFVIYDTLSEPNIKSMKSVIRATLAVTATVYVGVGLSGYYTFAGSMPLPGDILILYENTMIVNCIKFGFILSVAISFPLLIFPLRASVYSLIFLRKGPTTELSGESTVLMPDHRFRAITFSILSTTLLCGILVPNVEFVLAMTGSVTGSVIFFIFPATMYIRTFGHNSPKSSISSQSSKRIQLHAHLVLAVGLCVMIIGSMMALEDQKARMEPRKIIDSVPQKQHKTAGIYHQDVVNILKTIETKQKPKKMRETPHGFEARREPANPDKPAIKIFINSSKSKPYDSNTIRSTDVSFAVSQIKRTSRITQKFVLPTHSITTKVTSNADGRTRGETRKPRKPLKRITTTPDSVTSKVSMTSSSKDRSSEKVAKTKSSPQTNKVN